MQEQPAVTYEITEADQRRIEREFSYHAPRPDQIPRYNAIREKARELHELILRSCPPSMERSTALTGITGTVMSANASIARYETAGPPPVS